MKLRPAFSLLVISGAILAASAAESTPPVSPAPAPTPKAEDRPVFGPYEAIVFDHDTLQGVKVDAEGAIYLMFKPEKRGATVKIRISMAEGAEYRKWFNGEDELVALENGHREPDTWTDQVKTSANYIEYRDGDHLFLHLKKIKS